MSTFELIVQQPYGSTDTVKAIIKRDNPDLNRYLTVGTVGATPLWVATNNNHYSMVRLLLEHGADPNKKCLDKDICHEEAPIHIAAGYNHTKSLRILLEHRDINVDITMEEGVTAIFLAVQEDNLESVKLLLNAGANINIVRNRDGVSPLFMAVQRGSVKTLQWLINKYQRTFNGDGWVDFNIVDNNGVTPLIHSIRMDNETVFDMLVNIDKVNINKTDNNNCTALDYAVSDGLLSMVYKLLLTGVNINYTHIGNLHRTVTVWRWIDQTVINSDDKTNLLGIFKRATDPRIYGEGAIDPFNTILDKEDSDWNTSVRGCKYWLPIQSIHTRFPQEYKDIVRTFLLVMTRTEKGLWARIPKPLQYNIIEDFMKFNTDTCMVNEPSCVIGVDDKLIII